MIERVADPLLDLMAWIQEIKKLHSLPQTVADALCESLSREERHLLLDEAARGVTTLEKLASDLSVTLAAASTEDHPLAPPPRLAALRAVKDDQQTSPETNR